MKFNLKYLGPERQLASRAAPFSARRWCFLQKLAARHLGSQCWKTLFQELVSLKQVERKMKWGNYPEAGARSRRPGF